MILLNLTLKNFKKYRSYDIEFAQGLIGIIGKNGAGKSTIFEAILFALYGELKQRGLKENIRNAYASSKDVVSITLEFEFENIIYKIHREFRGKTLSANAKLYKNDELITTGAKEVTSSIVKLTNMSKDAFVNTLFASQKELTNLGTLKSEDRKKLIRKLLGLEKIDFIEKELILKIRDLKRDINTSAEYLLSKEDIIKYETNQSINQKNIDNLNSKNKDIQKDIDSLEKDINTIKKQLDIFEQTKEKKQQLHNKLELLSNTINTNKLQHTKLTKELEDLQNKQKELNSLINIKKEYEQIQIKLKEQEQLKEYFLQTQGLKKEQEQLRIQYKKYTSEIKELESQINDLDKYLTTKQKYIDEIQNIDKKIKQYQNQKNILLAQKGGEEKIISNTKSKIEDLKNLGKQSPCPTCTRPLLNEYDNVINSLQTIINEIQNTKLKKLSNQIDTIINDINRYENNKQELQQKLKQCEQDINMINYKSNKLKKIKDEFSQVKQKGLQNKQELEKLEHYSYNENEHKQIIKQQEGLKNKYEYILQLETQLKRYDKLKKEQENLDKTINEQKTKYKTDEQNYNNIKYDKNKHITTKEEFEKLQENIQKKQKESNETNIQIAKIQGEINSIIKTLENNKAQLAKVQLKKDDLSDYEKIKLSLADFKTKINSRISPRISSIASQMYSTITKGKYQYVEVDNDFDFYIYDDGVKYPISRFSGGEIDLANLVLRIAISKTLSELNGASTIGFLAFDEVFGSQDETRRMQILEAFHTIKEQYRQIFLISHEIDIKEMFEMVVEV